MKKEKLAQKALKQILEHLVMMARTPKQENMLKITLQKTLDLATELTFAEKGSMFLLDPHSDQVIDAILARSEVTPEQRQQLIDTVFDQGLAGWITRHLELALIIDTETNSHWLDLPNQPLKAELWQQSNDII